MSEKKILKIVSEVQEKGFQKVLQKYNLSSYTLLNLLWMASNNPVIIKEEQKSILEMIRKELICYQFQDKKIGVIADTHIGRGNQNWNYIKRIYESFAKAGIENVFHMGDLVEGYPKQYKNQQEKGKTICEEQIESVINNYPKGFNNYVIVGNHEKTFSEYDVDLEKLTSARKDIIFLNQENGINCVDYNKRLIILKHKITRESVFPFLQDIYLTIGGHSHYYDYNPEYRTLKVPICSDNHPMGRIDGKYQPGFVILENKEKGIIAHRYGFNENGVKHILKRVIKEENKY